MGQVADKRTKQATKVNPKYALYRALGVLTWHGRALFDDESCAGRRDALMQLMHRAFPGDNFAFWKRQEIENKAYLERLALLDALGALIKCQVRRVGRSLTTTRDPLRHFRRLYRKELLGHVFEDRVRSPWQLTEESDAVRVDSAGYLDKQSDVSFDEEMLKTVVVARMKRELYTFLLRCLRASARSEDDEKGPAHLRSILLLDSMKRGGVIASDEPGDSCTAQVLRELMQPPCDQCQGLTDGEHCAVGAAVRAILRGATPFAHSRRGDALSHYLTPNEMRQLRRACARCGEVKSFLIRNASQLRKTMEMVIPEARRQRKDTERTRGWVAHFTGMAEEVEASGDTQLATGLRAIVKLGSGRLLGDDDFDAIKIANQWLTQTYWPSWLKDIQWRVVPVEEYSGPAGTEAVNNMLLLALSCWPGGVAATRDGNTGIDMN